MRMEVLLVSVQCKKSVQHDVQHSLLCRAAAGVMPQDGHFGLVAAATRAQGYQC